MDDVESNSSEGDKDAKQQQMTQATAVRNGSRPQSSDSDSFEATNATLDSRCWALGTLEESVPSVRG